MPYLLKGITLLALLWALLTPLQGETPEQAPLAVTFAQSQLQGQTGIWQITETAGGQIVAAGERVGYYAKGRWEFLPEPRKPAIRCLCVDGDTLWVTSLNEIGKIPLPLNQGSRYE